MSAKKNRFDGWQLGAINGLALGVVAELLMRTIYAYERSRGGPAAGSEIIIDRMPYPFSWWYLPLLSLVLVTVASVIVHRYLLPHLRSQISRWPAIGALAIFELYLITLALDWWNASHSISREDYWQFAYSTKLFPWVLLIPGVIIFNLLFGWLIKTFSISRRLKSFPQ